MLKAFRFKTHKVIAFINSQSNKKGFEHLKESEQAIVCGNAFPWLLVMITKREIYF